VPDEGVPDEDVLDEDVLDKDVLDKDVLDELASGGGAAISDGDLGPDLRQELVPDTTDLTELVDGGEPAMSGAPVQNPL
jgi:hypothetical protein